MPLPKYHLSAHVPPSPIGRDQAAVAVVHIKETPPMHYF